MVRFIANMILLKRKLVRRIYIYLFKPMFHKCGKDVFFDATNSHFTYEDIELGNHVFISSHAWWAASPVKIIVGDYVMFGPNVTIMAGDHRTDRLDIPMLLQTKDEAPHPLDFDVVIEDDVWVGCNVTILKGVTIHRGAVVAAGSVVAKDVEAYAVVAGVPAKPIRSRLPDRELPSPSSNPP